MYKYIDFGTTEEEQYREKLYNLIEDYHFRDNIGISVSYQQLVEIFAALQIDADLSCYEDSRYINIEYHLSGYAESYNADRSDALVVSTSCFNNYGFAGAENVLKNVVPAKFLYEYICSNYQYSGGILRPIAA